MRFIIASICDATSTAFILEIAKTNEMINIKELTLYNLNTYYELWDDKNDMSAVFYFNHAGNNFLLMGDAPTKIEEQILKNNPSLECDILKLGHHGSKTSSSRYFLDNINPKLAIISVGNNSYGLPDYEVLEFLKQLQIPYYRTDSESNIKVSVNGVRKNY